MALVSTPMPTKPPQQPDPMIDEMEWLWSYYQRCTTDCAPTWDGFVTDLRHLIRNAETELAAIRTIIAEVRQQERYPT